MCKMGLVRVASQSQPKIMECHPYSRVADPGSLIEVTASSDTAGNACQARFSSASAGLLTFPCRKKEGEQTGGRRSDVQITIRLKPPRSLSV